MNADVIRPRHRLWRSWTSTAGAIDIEPVFPTVEPDERDGMTLAEIDEAAERAEREKEDEP